MFASVALVASVVKSKAFPVNNTLHITTALDSKVDISPDLVKAVTAELKKEIDAASTAGSQTTIVDEDSSTLLQSRVKNAVQHLLTSSSETSQVRLVDANHAIDYVAYGLSDIIFVYPGSASGYLGQELAGWAQQPVRNATNQLVKVVEMETRAGALQAVQGALADSTGKNLTVLASSQALLDLIPTCMPWLLLVNLLSSMLLLSPLIKIWLPLPMLRLCLLLVTLVPSWCLLLMLKKLMILLLLLIFWLVLLGCPVIHFFNGVTAAKEIEKVNLTFLCSTCQVVCVCCCFSSCCLYRILPSC